MGSVSKLALVSVICGVVALIASITWLGYYWLYEGSYPVWLEQYARALGVYLAPGVGLVGARLGQVALDQPGVRQGERRGRSMARVGIALGILPLLLFCLHVSVLGAFAH